ncbi:uncharacterized protein LOC135405074 [Pseudopipra pipra]|uniref:uncharacterized protein LOC135405074 n=1 Tax=Pseudopipra pipra TaxID=415032 RepID=UPI003138E7FF
MLLDTIIRRNRVKRESSGVEGSRSGTRDRGAGPETTERPRQHERGASTSAVHIQDDRKRRLQCESTADRPEINFTNTMTEFHLKTFPAFHLNCAAGLRCAFVAVFTALGAYAAVLSEPVPAPGLSACGGCLRGGAEQRGSGGGLAACAAPARSGAPACVHAGGPGRGGRRGGSVSPALLTAMVPGGFLDSHIEVSRAFRRDIYPVVANPYTLLTTLTEDLGWFTVLDLKDAFFCIPVHKDSQEIFAFEWENPETGRKTQLTWRVLPQGFKNSPTLFGNQLAKELEDWRRQQQEGVVLQYVDDILIAAKNRDQCIELTVSLLNFLGLSGYRVSREKAQIAKEIVIYLGLEIYHGHRRLSTDRKEAICRLPEPHTVREMQAFLGMVGWCRLWIANYGLLVKPLYEALKTAKEGVITWTDETRDVFKQLKQSLMSAPALGLPDLTKPFELFTHEQLNVALGVLSQTLGSQRRAVAYFSKQLDSVSQGWPGCLRAVAATVILIEEARKLTLGQHITVYVPHAVQAVLEQKGGHWLSPSRMLKYQVVLLEQDDVTLKTTSIVNPAMFLSSTLTDSVPEHDCLQTIEETYSSRPDLKDEPLENADWELYTDGSSFMRDGKRFTGYAVTTRDEVIEAKALSADVSSQKAELIALTRALELSEGKKVNIWTDSKYAFSVVHAHGAIWKERGLLTAQGSGVKHADQIHALLQSIWKPEEVAIMHCRAHQKGKTIPELGNQFADQAAKRATEKGILAVVPQKEIDLTKYTPKYDERDNQLIKSLKAEIKEGGWVVTPTGQVVVPPPLLREIAQQEHEATHWGTENLLKHLKKIVIGTNMTEAVQSTVGKCEICKRNNPDTSKRVVLGVTKAGDQPGDYWQIDFAELPPWGGYKYILVLVDTFSG